MESLVDLLRPLALEVKLGAAESLKATSSGSQFESCITIGSEFSLFVTALNFAVAGLVPNIA